MLKNNDSRAIVGEQLIIRKSAVVANNRLIVIDVIVSPNCDTCDSFS